MQKLRLKFLLNFYVLVFSAPVLFAGEHSYAKIDEQVKSVKEITVQLDLENASLRESFNEIENQTNLNFSYDEKLISSKEVNVSFNRKNATVENFLIHVSKLTNLKFKQVNTVISVQGINHTDNEVHVEVVLADLVVTGHVYDENGGGLPGATILEKGTANGTVTDVNGNYSITVNEGAILQFSFVGYETQEVNIGSRTSLDVTLYPALSTLEEVVVIGYGTQSRRDITTSVSSVSSEELEGVPVTGVDAMLQGRASGVQVVQNSGAPGAENYVRIRGNGSLLGQNRPLYIVDGVQMNNITTNVLDAGGQLTTSTNDINPNDIESVEILKDAAATAIYGARASNGVVLITTKRGKTGKSRFQLGMYTGMQKVSNKLDLLNGSQYVDFITESIANTNDLLGGNIEVPDFIEDTGINTDWQDEVFRSAPVSDFSLSMTGGSEKTQYFVSLGYFDQKGTIRNQAYDRFNARVNVDHQASKKLKIGNSITLSLSDNDRVFTDFNSLNPLATALVWNPNFPVYNEDGSYFLDPNNQDPLGNPVQLAEEITFNSKQKRVLGNVYAEYDIIEGLTFRTTFGVDYLNDRQQRFIPNTIEGFGNGAEATAANFEQILWSWENTLSYATSIGDDHSINALIGYSLLSREEYLLRAGGSLAGSNIVTTIAISNPSIPDNYLTNYGLVSYFGRVNYAYKDKYLVGATLRADGSSRFGENNRFGYFPSASVGWRISEESFMSGVNFINDFKLRGSLGVTGNQEGLSGDFPSLALYGTGIDYLSNFPGIAQTSIANPNLTWEETTQYDIGFDLTFLNSRVNIIADVYLKKTDNLLFFRQLPWSSGFSQDNGSNIGKMENKGLEIEMVTQNLKGEFTWTTSFNISFNRNKITSLPDFDPENPIGSDFSQQQPDAFGTDGTRSVFRVGESFGSFYGYKVLGVDPETGSIIYENLDGSVDENGNPTIGISDRQIFGNALPKHTGGFTNEFGYKGFTLNIFMQWSYGNDIYNQTAAVLESMTGYRNQGADVLNRWQNPGDMTDIPQARFEDPTGVAAIGANNREISDRFLEDGSFLRVKDIRLGYRFPNSIAEKLNLGSLDVYTSLRNAYTWTNYSGFDPESQNNSVVTAVGIDYLVQPQPRTFIVGLNVNF
ncbi:SusC/RagA family TonB-linked outer membrane protein [Marinigracilibium pacificum]|uniref:TonB-dependent receptor n=1 Tax=Marinigracilibium pacificum TaxID=2729599 RepID=A0A848ISX0_9BACT|nr:TonB-dependent receptor [Marinigracilibium pacificum]NMM47553.1 TonB-dependent receptor [Marinigracilibium pacificum]